MVVFKRPSFCGKRIKDVFAHHLWISQQSLKACAILHYATQRDAIILDWEFQICYIISYLML